MNDLLRRRRAMMRKVSGDVVLPDGFQKCVYLENSTRLNLENTIKYFDTLINPDLTHELEVKFEMLGNITTDGVFSQHCGYIGGGYNSIGYYNNGSPRCSYGTRDLGYNSDSLMPRSGVPTTVKYSWKDRYILNETTDYRLDLSAYEYTQPTTSTLRFFFRGYGPYSVTSAMRIYFLKMWSDGNLIRNYIPCLDNNGVPCFYEAVSGSPCYATPEGRPPFSYLLE